MARLVPGAAVAASPASGSASPAVESTISTAGSASPAIGSASPASESARPANGSTAPARSDPPALPAALPIDDATLEREYADYRKSLAGMQRYGVHYLVVASEDEARQLIIRIRSGGDFEALARELSLHEASAPAGGDLGVHAGCRWARDTVTMLDRLQPGQLNPAPVKGSRGWGVYRLDSREAVVPLSFERYREKLLGGHFEAECPWQPPVSVGTKAAPR